MTRIFRVNRERVRGRLGEWAQSLAERREVLLAVLFGSFARGDCTAASDADVLIVLRDSKLPFHERSALYQPSGTGVGVDVFAYTLAEARESLEQGWGVVRPACAEGEVLYAAADAPRLDELAVGTEGDASCASAS